MTAEKALREQREAAIRCFETGDFAAAARLLASLLARTRPDPLLLRLCGMAMLRTNAGAQALPYLARARRLAPQDPVAALWHGIGLHEAGRFQEAVTAFESSASLSPSDPAPLIHLTRALLKLARSADAAAVAQRAIALGPNLLEAWHALRLAELAVAAAGNADAAAMGRAWHALGMVCLRLGRVQDARAALQQAVGENAGHAEAAADLAVVEHLCGEPVTAIARLRGVLAGAPRCLLARIQLAGLLNQNGEPAEALAALGETAPDGALRARWQARRIDALTRLGRHADAAALLPETDDAAGDAAILLDWQRLLLARQTGDAAARGLAERVTRLAADRNAASLPDRIEAHFALARLHHGEGRREPAFAHWWQGHALMRDAQPFSRAAHTAFIAANLRAYDRPRLAAGPRAANNDPAPVFIVGLPRTGTTLTEHILAAHASVHGAGERLAVREMLRGLTGSADATEAITRAACLDQETLQGASDAYLNELHALAPGAARIIDKMPDNFSYLGFIATLLPGARVICCTRDPRDVGASIFQQGFFGYHPYAHDLADLGWTIAQHERLLSHWRTALTIPMIEIDHADWVGDFDATLRRALEFLDLPYDAACARFFEQDRIVRTASREQVNRPINAQGVGRWRAYAREFAPMLRELPAQDS